MSDSEDLFLVAGHKVVVPNGKVIAVCRDEYTAALIAAALHRFCEGELKADDFPNWDGKLIS
jgi:hypothetical protein